MFSGNSDLSTWLSIVLTVSVLDDDHLSWMAHRADTAPQTKVVQVKPTTKTIVLNAIIFATLGTMTGPLFDGFPDAPYNAHPSPLIVFFVSQQFNFKFNGLEAVEPIGITFALSQRLWHAVWLPRLNTVAMAVGIFSFLWPFGQLFLSALYRNAGSSEEEEQGQQQSKESRDRMLKTSLSIVHLTITTALTAILVTLSLLNFGERP